jgi:hypothetical protein
MGTLMGADEYTMSQACSQEQWAHPLLVDQGGFA